LFRGKGAFVIHSANDKDILRNVSGRNPSFIGCFFITVQFAVWTNLNRKEVITSAEADVGKSYDGGKGAVGTRTSSHAEL